jgi:hypothetical protein
MCLGIEESEGVQYKQMKESLKKDYTRRFRMILQSKLNDKHKITGIGA